MAKGALICCVLVAGLIILLILALAGMIGQTVPPTERRKPKVIDVTVKPGSESAAPLEDYATRRRQILQQVQSGQITIERAERLFDELNEP